MAADLWVQVETGLPSSKLVDRLCVALDIETHEAVGYLVMLWLGVMDEGIGGDLRERSDLWIERAAGWRGERGKFAASIRQYHLDDGVIRDWKEKYGKLEAIRAEAARIKRNQRNRDKQTDVAVDGPPERPVDVHRTVHRTPLPSPLSVSAVQEKKQDQEPVQRENGNGRKSPAHLDAVQEFVAEFDFGPFAESVEGFIRSQKSAAAVMATLRMHKQGEMGHEKATDREIGFAVQQYAASADGRFNSKYFRGFIADAKKAGTVVENRARNAAEQQHIDREAEATKAADREAQEAEKVLADFKAAQPERYEELVRIAEDYVPRKLTMGRDMMVHGKLLTLVRAEVAHAS